MRKTLLVAIAAVCCTWLAGVPSAQAGHSLGVGANYWKVLSDIEVKDVTDIDESGLSWLVSYQYIPEGLFKFEFDLEHYPKLGVDQEAFWSPEAFVLVGGTLYAGAGAGIYYSDGSFSNAPFFMLRAGLDFAILPFLSLDINANYRFNDWEKLEKDDVDTNTIRLGAAVRFSM